MPSSKVVLYNNNIGDSWEEMHRNQGVEMIK